jgi:lipopolysaccharide transport system permease protein
MRIYAIILSMGSDVQHFFELLFAMTGKELKARYKNTVFGFFWMVINPILQMFVIGTIFTFFMKQTVVNYYYYLFIGLLSWNFFSLSLTKSTPSIVFERTLIKKSAFPRAVIPLSIILSNAVHLTLALCIFLIPVAFLGTLSIDRIPAIIAGLILLLSFTVGISLLTSALDVRFRDINFFVQAILIVWFYITPIIYSFDFIPYHYIWIWRLNPLTSAVQLLQYGLLKAIAPGPAMLGANILTMFVVLILGITVFIKESKNFDDWV